MRAGGGGGQGGWIGDGAWLFDREQPARGRGGTKGVGVGTANGEGGKWWTEVPELMGET